MDAPHALYRWRSVHNTCEVEPDATRLCAVTETGDGTSERPIVLEIGALVLLTAGSLVSWVGWVGGVLLVWTSHRWTRRDKLIGSLLLPGGLAAAWWFARGPATVVCTTLVAGDESPDVGAACDLMPVPLPVMLAIQVALVVPPLAAAAWLGWRLRRTSG